MRGIDARGLRARRPRRAGLHARRPHGAASWLENIPTRAAMNDTSPGRRASRTERGCDANTRESRSINEPRGRGNVQTRRRAARRPPARGAMFSAARERWGRKNPRRGYLRCCFFTRSLTRQIRSRMGLHTASHHDATVALRSRPEPGSGGARIRLHTLRGRGTSARGARPNRSHNQRTAGCPGRPGHVAPPRGLHQAVHAHQPEVVRPRARPGARAAPTRRARRSVSPSAAFASAGRGRARPRSLVSETRQACLRHRVAPRIRLRKCHDAPAPTPPPSMPRMPPRGSPADTSPRPRHPPGRLLPPATDVPHPHLRSRPRERVFVARATASDGRCRQAQARRRTLASRYNIPESSRQSESVTRDPVRDNRNSPASEVWRARIPPPPSSRALAAVLRGPPLSLCREHRAPRASRRRRATETSVSVRSLCVRCASLLFVERHADRGFRMIPASIADPRCPT